MRLVAVFALALFLAAGCANSPAATLCPPTKLHGSMGMPFVMNDLTIWVGADGRLLDDTEATGPSSNQSFDPSSSNALIFTGGNSIQRAPFNLSLMFGGPRDAAAHEMRATVAQEGATLRILHGAHELYADHQGWDPGPGDSDDDVQMWFNNVPCYDHATYQLEFAGHHESFVPPFEPAQAIANS